MTTTDKLLPCPWCGGKATVDMLSHGMMWPYCTECQATTPMTYGYADKAIAAWNRRASQAAPAPSDYAISKEWAERMLPLDEGVTPSAGAPAPSDALREALEECDCCVDGLQADGETPCPYCTKPTIPVADAAEALLEAYKSGAWVIGRGRTLEQVAMIIAALRAALSTPTEERQ